MKGWGFTTLLCMALLAVWNFAQGANRDVCRSGSFYDTIQAAIDAAAPGDSIRVVQGTYPENLSINGRSGFNLYGGYADNSFALRDPSAYATIVDGRGITHTVYIFNSNGITLDGFILKNGQAFSGGGIHVESREAGSSDTVTITNSTVSENFATYGGGISAESDTPSSLVVNVSSSRITGNRAERSGGGIGVSAETGSLIEVISNGNIISNNSAANYGGGIYLNPVGAGSVVQLTSKNDTINNNRCGIHGGGIGSFSDSADRLSLIMLNTSVHENTCSFGTSGIFIFPQDSALESSMINSSILNNDGYRFYIRSDKSDFNLNLKENTISGNRNSGILIDSISSTGKLNLESNALSGNSSFGENGDGISIVNTSSNLSLLSNKNKLISNGYSINGGGIYLENHGTLSGVLTNNIIVNSSCNVRCQLTSDPQLFGGGIFVTKYGL